MRLLPAIAGQSANDFAGLKAPSDELAGQDRTPSSPSRTTSVAPFLNVSLNAEELVHCAPGFFIVQRKCRVVAEALGMNVEDVDEMLRAGELSIRA